MSVPSDVVLSGSVQSCSGRRLRPQRHAGGTDGQDCGTGEFSFPLTAGTSSVRVQNHSRHFIRFALRAGQLQCSDPVDLFDLPKQVNLPLCSAAGLAQLWLATH